MRGTSSPSTSFRKTLLKERSMIRESSIALATNWPMTLMIWVRFLVIDELLGFATTPKVHLLNAVFRDVIRADWSGEKTKRMMHIGT